jgi:methanogenic corrinoid protein MtbC1
VLVSPHSGSDQDPSVEGDGLTIKAAGSYLGVPGPTLRSWERRYGLPTTSRSIGGHRRYRSGDLVQLSLMRDEIAIGRRAADAARWVRGILDDTNPGVARVRALLKASRAHDPQAIRAVLDLARAEIGLGQTLDQVVMPAMRQVGAWWETGDCDVGLEHLTTEVVRRWLARIVTLAPAPDAARRIVLLATGPADSHTLGLEALAAQLAELGTASRMLGPRTSLPVLLAAVEAAPGAVVVVVSHLMSQRRATVASLVALAEAGTPAFFAGNAFLLPVSRKEVPGSYLGETIGGGALVIAEHSRGSGSGACD